MTAPTSSVPPAAPLAVVEFPLEAMKISVNLTQAVHLRYIRLNEGMEADEKKDKDIKQNDQGMELGTSREFTVIGEDEKGISLEEVLRHFERLHAMNKRFQHRSVGLEQREMQILNAWRQSPLYWPNAATKTGETILMRIAGAGRCAAVSAVLATGAQVNG